MRSTAAFCDVGYRWKYHDEDWYVSFHETRFYVTAATVDRWLGSFGRTGIIFFEGAGIDGLLALRTFDSGCYVDDVTVDQIEPSEVPDYEAFSRAYSRLVPLARPGDTLPVPELQRYATPGKKVLLEYDMKGRVRGR